jgi:hypothetical protein
MIKILTLFLAISLISCSTDEIISPSGSITKVQKNHKNFTTLEVNNGFAVVLTFNKDEKVEVEANENIQNYIETDVSSNKLKLKRKDNINFTSGTKVKIYVSANKIDKIIATGGSNISCSDKFLVSDLELDLSGGSIITADLGINNLKADMSGGSILNLRGTSNTFVLSASGGSKIGSYDLYLKKLDCDISGGSTIELTVNEQLIVNASGGSIINYKGTGTIKSQNLSGGSQIIKK